MTKNNTGRKLALGAIIAGVAGYLAGILTAPKSGKETRQDIANKAESVKEGTVDQLKSAQTELETMLKTAKTKSLALSSKTREEYNEAVIKAKDAKNKAAAVIKGVKDGSSSNPELDKALRQANLARKNLGKYLKS